MEEAGMSDEVLQKLQDKATLLTAERKKVGWLDLVAPYSKTLSNLNKIIAWQYKIGSSGRKLMVYISVKVESS